MQVKEPGAFRHAPPWRQASPRLISVAASSPVAVADKELAVCNTDPALPKVSGSEPAAELLSSGKMLAVVRRSGERELEPLSLVTPVTPTAHSSTSSSHVAPAQPGAQEQAKLPGLLLQLALFLQGDAAAVALEQKAFPAQGGSAVVGQCGQGSAVVASPWHSSTSWSQSSPCDRVATGTKSS